MKMIRNLINSVKYMFFDGTVCPSCSTALVQSYSKDFCTKCGNNTSGVEVKGDERIKTNS